MAAASEGGSVLKLIPEELKTPGLCLAAVLEDGLALKWVPDALKTPRMCAEALKQSLEAADFVPERLQEAARGIRLERAYDRGLLEDAMLILGTALAYAVRKRGMNGERFFRALAANGAAASGADGKPLWRLQKMSCRQQDGSGQENKEDGEICWLDAALGWTIARQIIDPAVRWGMEKGLTVYDPQADKIYRRKTAFDARWRCHAMAMQLCALARRLSPFVDAIFTIEESALEIPPWTSASYAIVIRGDAGTVERRLRKFCRDFDAEMTRTAHGDDGVLHCGRSLEFAASDYRISFSIEGYAGMQALAVHMDGGEERGYLQKGEEPGMTAVEPLNRPRIADVLKEAKQLAEDQGFESDVFARLHLRRMERRWPGMADRLADSVELEKRMRDVDIVYWSTHKRPLIDCIEIHDVYCIYRGYPDEDCLLFNGKSISFLEPSISNTFPKSYHEYFFINTFTIPASHRIAEDLKKWIDCLETGRTTHELLEHVRCCNISMLDPECPWKVSDEEMLRIYFSQKERLLWFYNFMIEWFEEVPEDEQDRCYNIVGL